MEVAAVYERDLHRRAPQVQRRLKAPEAAADDDDAMHARASLWNAAAIHPVLDHRVPVGFAHRGGAGEAPENTLPAFEAAVALGYRYLETDVHLTRDGVLVAFHDALLERVTDGTGSVAGIESAALAE